MNDLTEKARKAISLLDLTNLNDDCSEADIRKLAHRAATSSGNVAALCIYSPFIKTARESLGNLPIKIATVANFPDGSSDHLRTAAETAKAFADGADEVDIVIPYSAVLAGEHRQAATVVTAAAAVKPEGKTLKVILETGELKSGEMIRTACRIALDHGADFLKTSTGKVSVNATLESARILIEEVKASGRAVGFKAAGGIKTAKDTIAYLDLAAEIMGPNWATPATFRFGASAVLDDLIAAAGGQAARVIKAGY